ncbi:flagellar export chaperone FliS [bacterium]|nr:flagellar export chaperone FliS [bacterium]
MLATAQQIRKPSATAHEAYKQTQVQTADKARLVVLMFEGVMRFCKTLEKNIKEDKIADSYYYQTKALQVMAELTNSLDTENEELGKVLFNLYEYITVKIAKVNVRDKDTRSLVEVIEILADLLNTIKQAFGLKTKLMERG